MRTYNSLPIFLVNVDDDDCTITTISLVDEPAMQLPMYCFGKDKEMVKYMFEDDSRHNIISCIVRTDYPILRMTEDGNPYYIVFNKETSEKLAQRLMTDGYQQNVSLDHNGKLISGITLQEVFIKDTVRGIDPKGYEDAAEGSLFGVYHIDDENLWNDVVEGKFGGVSLESYLSLESFKKIDIIKNNHKNHMSRIKEMLKNILMEFNNLSTDKAELYWEEDTELEVGYKVFVNDSEGNKTPAEDGEYVSDENIIKVEGGVVTSIEKKDPAGEEKEDDADDTKEEVDAAEEPETPAEETPAEPETPAEEPEEDKVAELEKRVISLEAKVEELISKIAEIATAPAAEPVIDEFEQAIKKKTTGDKNLDKRIALAAALREN